MWVIRHAYSSNSEWQSLMFGIARFLDFVHCPAF
jgi:hypothetical protein